jgi:hypothetical protein
MDLKDQGQSGRRVHNTGRSRRLSPANPGSLGCGYHKFLNKTLNKMCKLMKIKENLFISLSGG